MLFIYLFMEPEERKTSVTVSCSLKYVRKIRELGMSPTEIFDAGLKAKDVK